MNVNMKILIAAGGTGGHIFPALSIASELQRQGAEVHWAGSYIGLEKKIVELHYPIHLISIKPIRGKGFFRKFSAFLSLMLAVGTSLALLIKLKPNLVICMGGFVSGPAGIAAYLLGIPLIIHESNAIPGLTNRLLSKFAKRILSGFPNTFPDKKKFSFVGNPIRPAIVAIPTPEFRQQKSHKNFRLLILGGSRGAHAINETVIKALPLLNHHETLEIWHQAGEKDFSEIKKIYEDFPQLNAKVSSFIDDMVSAYSWADLVICRSGAMTISELSAVGLPSILIPFPYAVDDHQFYNAQYLVNADAGVLIRENELTPEWLANKIENLKLNPLKLLEMAKNARKSAHIKAVNEIAAICFEEVKKFEGKEYRSILYDPKIKHIHCIGIGGIGVSGIAEILKNKGYVISGSDSSDNRMTEYLKGVGVDVTIGHDASHIRGVDAVIYSSAIQKNNVEFAAAVANQLPLIQRGKILAELMQAYTGIAVAGTHGKTTTSGLIADCLLKNNIDATFVIGGVLNNRQSPAHLGTAKYFVAESDESDASFLFIKPKYAIVTNIDSDHLSAYSGSFTKLKKSFIKFLNRLPKDGVAILCIDDSNVRSIIPELTCRVITYGFSADAVVRADEFQQMELHSYAKIYRPDEDPLNVMVNLPGKHNLLNALSVIALASFINISDKGLLNALSQFPGVGRRFQSHGEIQVNGGKALLFDDYGHHPNEIEATVQAARNAWPSRRIVMVFQPHRYSRTKELMNDFAKVLKGLDLLLLLDIYSAGEPDVFNIDSRDLQKLIVEDGAIKPLYISKMDDLPAALKKVLKAEDIVIFQGAGSIGPYANQIVKMLIPEPSSRNSQ